jgi:hypothetical protein
MQTLELIVNKYPITTEEYGILDKKFGNLCHYAAWQLKRKNSQNSMVNDPEDDVQELRIALVRAGSYYKRQCFIESCFESLNAHAKDKFIKMLVNQLEKLWLDRRKHGANRQKFGEFQEIILEKLVLKHVPKQFRPTISNPLIVDSKFATYCKQIIWNAQKALGKQITKEKSWRSGLISLSEFDYLAS